MAIGHRSRKLNKKRYRAQIAISNRDSKTKDIGHRSRNVNKEDNRRYRTANIIGNLSKRGK